MNERTPRADSEVMYDLVRAASKEPQQLEAMMSSLIDQAQRDPAVGRALTIATRAALRSRPRAK
ncbi:hypothetical protein [Promicromonospora sukumoe]|uniref:Uncharacterized protein n=1 Tax=Promicromonospora sukumoe TaxID=88382 RepID=A0A7W3J7P6_9MICO|nr:hypothetical protein [Promicromonospora sukumoe]MBA8807709.1 hypothetical protein [Promicromonospora sukumoe]